MELYHELIYCQKQEVSEYKPDILDQSYEQLRTKNSTILDLAQQLIHAGKSIN